MGGPGLIKCGREMDAESWMGLGEGGILSSPLLLTLPQVNLLSRKNDRSVTSWGLLGTFIE